MAKTWAGPFAGIVIAVLALVAVEGNAVAACTGTTTATCDTTTGTYTSTITYNNPGQSLTLTDNVVVSTGANIGIWLQGGGTQTLNTGNNVTISNTGGNDAILIIGPTGNPPGPATSIVINAAGAAVTAGGQDAWGYDVWGSGSINATVGNVTANGNGGVPVYMTSNGGPVSITTGNITATGNNSSGFTVYGVYGTSTDSATPRDVTINTTGGTVSLTGTTATGSGIYASSYGTVTVKTAGVQVAGNAILTNGVFATSFGTGANGKVTVDTSAGDVTLTGTALSALGGIFAGSSGGPVEVTTGNVSTKASSSAAVQAQTAGTGVNGAVTVTTTAGLIKTEGAGTIGINASNTAASGGGLVTVHAGNVTTTGTGAAYGIKATNTSGGITVTAGEISTQGVGAYGINASGGGALDISADSVMTMGDSAHGIYASGTGTAAVDVTAGDITTNGLGAYGIQAVGLGTVTIDSTAGTITTMKKNGRGISVDKASGATVVHAGTIETSGDNAAGIHVYSGTFTNRGAGGAITVTAHSIHVTGETVKGNSGYYEVGNSADGIDVATVGSGEAGRIIIDTSVGLTPGTLGSVIVEGRKSRGIVAVSGTPAESPGPGLPSEGIGGGPIEITTGDVITLGDFGTAISAESWGSGADGAITITTLGTVSAKGKNIFFTDPNDPERTGNYQPNGISAFAWGGGDITITTHDVSSVGDAASAISTQSGNAPEETGQGKVTIDTTAGTVSSEGASSHGISVGNTSGVVKITTADVTTEGDLSNGIQAGNTGPNSAMTIDTTAGKITTKGWSATGISVGTGSVSTGKNAGLLKILAGDIETQGESAVGIGAAAYDGSIEIEVNGDITTGLLGGDGVQVSANGATSAKVTVTGSIVTQAAAADGLQISGIGDTNSSIVIVNGEINAQGANANGILAGGGNDNITVNADGVVTGNKAGIRLEQRGAATVTNKGHITGTGGVAVEFVGNYASTFDNSGTVTGSVLLGSGNDTAILRTGSSISGDLDAQGGTADKLQLAGTGTGSADVSKILNFKLGEKNDAGTWTLTGDNASFMPTFSVNAGRLAIDGTLGSTAFTVASGAVLGGKGTTGAVTVNAGGKLAPGNSIDTLHTASATFAAGAIYEVEINATTNDLLVVAGTATIDGAAQVAVLPETATYEDGHRYQILTAGLRSGAFSPVVIDNSAFLDFALDQTIENEVWLTITLVADLPDVAETPNQIATAGAIDEQGPGTPLFDAIIPLDADAARHAFDLLSGEIHATEKDILIDDSRFVREAILQRLDDAFGVPAAGGAGADPAGPMIASWAQAFGSGGRGVGDGNAASYRRSIGGFIAGIDLGEPGAWRFGIAAGYQSAGLSVPDRASTAQSDGYHFAAYGGLETGPFALRFGGALTTGTVDTVRDATFGGFSETLTARYGARTGQVFAEASYRAMLGSVAFAPFASVAHIAVDTDGFTESGGDAALSAGPEHRAMTLASFGARFAAPLPMAGARLTALFAWQHRSGDMTPTASLAFDGGTPFTVAGVPRKRDSLRVEAGFEWDISPRATFSAGYAGNIASGASDHGAKATLKFRF